MKDNMKEERESTRYMLHKRWWKQLSPEEKKEYTRRRMQMAQTQIKMTKKIININQGNNTKEDKVLKKVRRTQ